MVYKDIRQLILLVLICFACTKTTSLEDNPLDPGGGDYEIPLVTIISDFQPGDAITSESISIVLEGNDLVVEYRIRLDESEWTDWSNENSFTLDYLDEGNHTIYGQSRYLSSDESEIMSLDFTVDAVSGPSLMFFPRRITATQGETVTFSIMAEEVYDLAGTEFILNYDPATVSVENVLTGDIFSDMGDIFFFYEDKPSEGKLIITSAVWGSGEPSYTGTAVIAEVSIQITQLGEIDIVFDGSELFRDPDNESIQINTTVPGKIESY